MHDDSRMTRLALDTVLDLAAEAHQRTVEVSRAHRLALAWLVRVGIVEPWQARQFIDALSQVIGNPITADTDHYIRAAVATSSLHQWSRNAGVAAWTDAALSVRQRRFALEMLDDSDARPQPWLMCNRYLRGNPNLITRLFAAQPLRPTNEGPDIVHPRDPGYVVRRADGMMVLEQMTWGFPVILRGAKGAPLKPRPVNNSRFDKLDKFWLRWSRDPAHRCLIPARAYAEAEGPSGSMRTTWLSLKHEPLFAWAGLWADSPEWGPVYTGVMTDNALELAEIHDRSPVILARDDWQTWLTAPLDQLGRFDRPWPAAETTVTRTPVLWRDGGRTDAYVGTMPAPPWEAPAGN